MPKKQPKESLKQENDLDALKREYAIAAPEKQAELIKSGVFSRSFSFERESVDKDSRTVWMSISTEAPYERWFGMEILDHSASAINTDRLRNGAPLLVDHNHSDPVGVVESYEITAGRKLRILARFGKSARAEEIFQDVLDGIRKNTSVGYMIDDLVLEKQEGELKTYRVTRWTPYEGSLVSVPADFTCGVGRNLEKLEVKMTEKTKEAVTVQTVQEPVNAESIAQREIQRVSEILAAGDEFREMGGSELAREIVKDSKNTVETFKARMLEKMRASQKVTATAQPAEFPSASGNITAHYRYSKLKAFTRDLILDNGRVMKAEEAAYRSGQWLLATVYGSEKAKRFCVDNGLLNTRVMSGSSLSAGGALIPTEMEQAVIDLRDTYGVARQLARVRPMTSDSKEIPRRDGGLTAYFFTDTDNTGPTASDKTWGVVTLVAKKVGVLAKVSKDMVEDAIINVVDDLVQESAYAFAVKEDQCYLIGDGTSTYGGIQGIKTKLQGTSYASRVTLTTGHDTFAEIDATDLANVMGSVAAYAKVGAVWLCSETAKSVMFDRLAAAAGGNTSEIVAGMSQARYLGYPIITSPVMPTDTGDISSTIMFMFGRFDLASTIGARRGIEFQVLNERYAELGQIGIMATERFDMVTHDLGTTSAGGFGPVSGGYGN